VDAGPRAFGYGTHRCASPVWYLSRHVVGGGVLARVLRSRDGALCSATCAEPITTDQFPNRAVRRSNSASGYDRPVAVGIEPIGRWLNAAPRFLDLPPTRLAVAMAELVFFTGTMYSSKSTLLLAARAERAGGRCRWRDGSA